MWAIITENLHWYSFCILIQVQNIFVISVYNICTPMQSYLSDYMHVCFYLCLRLFYIDKIFRIYLSYCNLCSYLWSRYLYIFYILKSLSSFPAHLFKDCLIFWYKVLPLSYTVIEYYRSIVTHICYTYSQIY